MVQIAWTTPPTLTDGQVLTGAHTQIWRDDLNLTPAALATSQGQYFVATGTNSIGVRAPSAGQVQLGETTTSTTYATLTAGTVGPTAAVSSGTNALVCFGAKMQQSTSSAEALASYAISGATTLAASDLVSISTQFPTAGTESHRITSVIMQSGMTAGSNTFTVQYRVTANTGTFDRRTIAVLPF